MLTASAQSTDDAKELLRDGLFEEEANRNLTAAIDAYEKVVALMDEQRELAATAIFRLGECYRKQGDNERAAAQYRRILDEFADQPNLAVLSHQNLNAIAGNPATGSYGFYEIRPGDTILRIAHDLGTTTNQVHTLNPGLDPTHLRIGKVIRVPGKTTANVAADDVLAAVSPTVTTANLTAEEQEELLRIEALAKRSPDLLSAQDAAGRTPLHLAAKNGYLEVAKRLVSLGAKLDAVSKNGVEPLHEAASSGQLAIVKLLLDAGVDVNAGRESRQSTALHNAVAQGFTAVTKLLVERGADVHAQVAVDQSENGALHLRTPIHLAARGGYLDMVAFLLESGAQFDSQPSGSTPSPLYFAVNQNSLPVAGLLLEKGASPNFIYSAEREEGYRSLRELNIRARGSNYKHSQIPLLYDAVAIGIKNPGQELPMVKLLIDNGADLDVVDSRGVSPLLLSVIIGLDETTEMLLHAGADPDLGRIGYSNALLEAISKSKADIVGALLEADAELHLDESPDPLRVFLNAEPSIVSMVLKRLPETLASDVAATLIAEFAGQGRTDVLNALIEHDAERMRQVADEKTFLLWLALRDGPSSESLNLIFERLLKIGADPNVKGSDFRAPRGRAPRVRSPGAIPNRASVRQDTDSISLLRAVARAGNTRWMRMLLEAGAEPLEEESGQLLQGPNPEIVELLLEKFPDLLKTNEGKEAIVTAVTRPNAELLKIYCERDMSQVREVANGEGLVLRIIDDGNWTSGSARSMWLDVMSLLLDSGANPNLLSPEGRTAPLMRAVGRRDQELASMLLDHGADPNLVTLDWSVESAYSVAQHRIKDRERMIANDRDHRGNRLTKEALATYPKEISEWKQISELLYEHGADPFLHRKDILTLSRDADTYRQSLIRRDEAGWSEISLFEFLNVVDFRNSSDLKFPDFNRLTVYRVDREARKEVAISVDVEDALMKGDCSADIPLQWGDRIEIPEAVHPQSAKWEGLSPEVEATLHSCSAIEVVLEIDGTAREWVVARHNRGVYEALMQGAAVTLPNGARLEKLSSEWRMILAILKKREGVGSERGIEQPWFQYGFNLESFLKNSYQLLSNSDLTRVEVTRTDTATGEVKTHVFDASGAQSPRDLWLEDGDVIRVPSK